MNLDTLIRPFELIRCSWPKPVVHRNLHWDSEPEWGLPTMPCPPKPRWRALGGEQCWTIDWQDAFRGELKPSEERYCGQMRGFHIVFTIRVNGSGRLVFWDDDGCIVRRNGQTVHVDRSAHEAQRHELDVVAGDYLEIAQWQSYGEWLWGGRLEVVSDSSTAVGQVFEPYLGRVQERLREPNGPPLKMYFDGQYPVCTLLSLYSMILNGYRPSEVHIFGEYQWTPENRALFSHFFQFARIVETEEVVRRLRPLGRPRLIQQAMAHWYVMKICVGLLCPPNEYCFMDDDVFVLNRIEPALDAFKTCALVFAPDWDHSNLYLKSWGKILGNTQLPTTGTVNTGFYCLRNNQVSRALASDLMRLRIGQVPGWIWEQGFMANRFAREKVRELPSQECFYPVLDGLPGGILGYDYHSNPCGFGMIHFGGIGPKPTSAVGLVLARDILDRDLSNPRFDDAKGSIGTMELSRTAPNHTHIAGRE